VLFNQEAEQAVVGALFLQEGLVKECRIQPEHLYHPPLRQLLRAIKQVDAEDKPVDTISVMEQMGYEQLESIGGLHYVVKLVDSVPTTANFSYYEQIVLDYDKKRKVIEVAQRLMQSVKNEESGSVIQQAISQLMQIEAESFREENGQILNDLIAVYNVCERDRSEGNGMMTGYAAFDQLLGGFQEGQFCVVGARPSVGKTAFALNIAAEVAKEHVCLYFSLEMSTEELLKRMACLVGDIHSMKMRHPSQLFDERDWNRLSYSLGHLSQSHLRIFDRASMNVQDMWSVIRKMRREFGVNQKVLVVIDYLQLIAGSGVHRQNRQAEISEISRSLKQMAREMNVTVLALSQLSRGVESRQNKRPMLSDLRESGQIEQDADIISFLYREDYYDRHTEEPNKMEVIVAKQRNGPIGTVTLDFKKESGRFIG